MKIADTSFKEVKKFEKTDYKLRKCKLDIALLETFLEKNVIPKFLNFCVSNLHLKTSRVYFSYQMKMLREEISKKTSKLKKSEKDFVMLKRKLIETLGIIDHTRLCCF